MNQPTLLTKKEVAKLLRTSITNLDVIVNRDHIPKIKTGPGANATILFDIEDINKWIEKHKS